jgi:DNA-binding transcriptional regulator YiaG
MGTGQYKYWWARRPFTYHGINLRRGMIVQLCGLNHSRDEQLTRLGYFGPFTDEKWYEYSGSRLKDLRDGHRALPNGKVVFTTYEDRENYGAYVDRAKSESDLEGFVQDAGNLVPHGEPEAASYLADEEEREIAKDEKKYNEVAPLNMHKTQASIQAGLDVEGEASTVTAPTPEPPAPQKTEPVSAEVSEPSANAPTPEDVGVPTTGAELAIWRQAYGMSQNRCAVDLGLSASTIKKIESASRKDAPLGDKVTQAVLDYMSRAAGDKE